MANDLIKKARAKKNKYYDDNIEMVLSNLEQRIIVDAENGKSKTRIDLINSLQSIGLTIDVIANSYTDKFIESIIDHFDLEENKVVKVFDRNFLPTKTIAIEIRWGEEYE
ncbi:hypothetical protein [Macrococcus capreoli]|uniref:hypothetical protein n=1 Tax=Macrococcus capreoli TaxID=2982690 RepID=UPI003F435D2B